MNSASKNIAVLLTAGALIAVPAPAFAQNEVSEEVAEQANTVAETAQELQQEANALGETVNEEQGTAAENGRGDDGARDDRDGDAGKWGLLGLLGLAGLLGRKRRDDRRDVHVDARRNDRL